jgi:eukaryotic-like serine/threonine-protein kinase
MGGMATVYLAYDLRHDRKVAVKVVRPELAAIIGGERFLAEIRTTANLQHPHILPLHDSGEADGNVFYVMPFVEGQSLRERLQHEKQLPIDEAVRITREIASALDYAHRHGVVHRDIKPENVLLHDGQALVADFGIALAVSRSEGGTRMTETGMSLGTPHYMAPEQAMGEREISARADVYALGCVLYECLSGEPPFTGPTAQAIIARVMTEQPRGLQIQRRTIPPNVEAAVRTALEKLPADRFASAAAFSDALGNPAYGASDIAAARHPAGAARSGAAAWNPRHWTLPTWIFAGAAVLLAAFAGWASTRTSSSTAVSGLGVLAFQAMDSVPGRIRPVVSDAGTVAWVGPGGVFVRPPGATQPMLLPGTEGAIVEVLDFSPDGESLVFALRPPVAGATARFTLRRIATTGGVPHTLTADLGGHPGAWLQGATWGADGNVYIGASDLAARLGTLLRVPANGGIVDTLLRVDQTFVAPNAALPGYRTLLLTLAGTPIFEPRIIAFDLRSRDTTLVLANALSAHWSPTGHLLVARQDGTLLAMPFDAGAVRALGSPIPVADSVAAEDVRSRFSVSANGTLAYVRGASNVARAGELRLSLITTDGEISYLPLQPTDHFDGSFSPDGRRLAYTRRDQIWIYDLDLGTHRQVTHSGTNHHNPVWSPDGRRLALRGDYPNQPAGYAYATEPDGDTTLVRLGGAPGGTNITQWLADGTILFSTEAPAADVYRIRADSEAPAVPVLTADWAERGPKVSPDGRWIAYTATEDGTNRTYVRRWPDLSGKALVSEAVPNISHSIWSLDSRTLFVQEGEQLVALALDPDGGAVRVTGRRVVRENVLGPVTALHPDGRRMLHFSRSAAAANVSTVTPRMILISNWYEQLRERLGSATVTR